MRNQVGHFLSFVMNEACLANALHVESSFSVFFFVVVVFFTKAVNLL